MRKLLLSFAFLLFALAINAQDNFNIDELPNVLVRELNKFRIKMAWIHLKLIRF